MNVVINLNRTLIYVHTRFTYTSPYVNLRSYLIYVRFKIDSLLSRRHVGTTLIQRTYVNRSTHVDLSTIFMLNHFFSSNVRCVWNSHKKCLPEQSWEISLPFDLSLLTCIQALWLQNRLKIEHYLALVKHSNFSLRSIKVFILVTDHLDSEFYWLSYEKI